MSDTPSACFLVPLDVRRSVELRSLVLTCLLKRHCPKNVMKRIWEFVLPAPPGAHCATFAEAKEIARDLPYARQVKLLRDWTMSSEDMDLSGMEGDDGLVIDGCDWTLHCPAGSCCCHGRLVRVTLQNMTLQLASGSGGRRRYCALYFEDAVVTLHNVTIVLEDGAEGVTPLERSKWLGGEDLDVVMNNVKVVCSNDYSSWNRESDRLEQIFREIEIRRHRHAICWPHD